MNLSTVTTVLTLLSGVALFLYGMNVMGDGLKSMAGGKLELILYRLTNTPLKGLLLGAGVTAIIQSSSATSVMVVGFVNSGLMKLSQAMGIIMGANIGTSITGWVICLSYIDGQQGLAQLFSTATLTAIVAIAGIIMHMFVKKESLRSLGSIMLGFAVLMVGLQMMSGAVAPLKDNPVFVSFLTTFSNPLLGILFGLLMTTVIQSASAAVGILQALSVTGAITFSNCFPMLMGIGIGAATPVLLSSIGTSTNAKRAALTYLLNDLYAMCLGVVLFYGSDLLFHWPIHSMVMDPFSIAVLNTLYRTLAMCILLPFVKQMQWVVTRLLPERDEDEEEAGTLDLLEDRFLAYPALAISQCQKAVDGMAMVCVKNLSRTMKLFEVYSDKAFGKIQMKERRIDQYEDKINTYLMKVTKLSLNAEQSAQVSEFLHVIPDFERIGDHTYHIAKVARDMAGNKAEFSQNARAELFVAAKAVMDITDLTVESFEKADTELAERVEPLREMIRILCDELKHRHTKRLKEGACSLEQAFAFNELINNLERIADHCSNVAVYMIESGQLELDTHKFIQQYRKQRNEMFQKYFKEYEMKYEI